MQKRQESPAVPLFSFIKCSSLPEHTVGANVITAVCMVIFKSLGKRMHHLQMSHLREMRAGTGRRPTWHIP